MKSAILFLFLILFNSTSVYGISSITGTSHRKNCRLLFARSYPGEFLELERDLLLPRAIEAKNPLDPKYITPKLELQYREKFSMTVYDLKGRDLTDTDVLAEIREVFDKYGKVHVTNNSRYIGDLPRSVLESLGFGAADQFKWGGQFSGRTVRKRLDKDFHGVDAYPAHLPVLAHNEITYQPVAPRRLLFHYRVVSGEGNGGRTFVHSAIKLVEELEKSGDVGTQLLAKLKKHGQLIKTGYIDENHPNRDQNYLRSWQVQFNTSDIDIAIERASGGLSYHDKVWKVRMPERDAYGNDLYLLMTSSIIPLFNTEKSSGTEYFIFPRLGYDGPHLANGFREYLIGNGEEFSKAELDVLLAASWNTREGIYQRPGDVLIVDNLRFAHSREPYNSFDSSGQRVNRSAGIVMAGRFYSDDAKGRRIRDAIENGNVEFLDPKE
jgi:hypothetical protein